MRLFAVLRDGKEVAFILAESYDMAWLEAKAHFGGEVTVREKKSDVSIS